MNKIIDAKGIAQKTTRMAYQIYEENFNADGIVLIGIAPAGYDFAQRIKSDLEKIAPFAVELIKMDLDKSNPLDEKNTLSLSADFTGKTVLLIDDVANTGKTLYYALKPIMTYLPYKVQIAVLVDRRHKLFPIAADFVGLRLNTTLNEHITVKLNAENGEDAVYLN